MRANLWVMSKREKRIEQLQIRLTSSEKKWLLHEANKAGLDISTWVKERVFSSHQRHFLELVSEIQNKTTRKSGLAALNDFLQELESRNFNMALQDFPKDVLSENDANYVAAMVEMAAFQKGLRPPKWTMNLKGLDQPYFGTELQSLWPHLLVTSPIPFRRRNIFIDSSIGNRI